MRRVSLCLLAVVSLALPEFAHAQPSGAFPAPARGLSVRPPRPGPVIGRPPRPPGPVIGRPHRPWHPHRPYRRGYGWNYGYGYGWGGGSVVQQNVAVENGLGGAVFNEVPVVAGIRSEPAGQPVVYVLNAQPRRESDRSPGARVVEIDRAGEGEDRAGGPRVIHLDVRRGR